MEMQEAGSPAQSALTNRISMQRNKLQQSNLSSHQKRQFIESKMKKNVPGNSGVHKVSKILTNKIEMNGHKLADPPLMVASTSLAQKPDSRRSPSVSHDRPTKIAVQPIAITRPMKF